MTTYHLNVSFTLQQLQVLYATGTNLVLSKSNDHTTSNVAWVVVRPFRSNSISWQEEYGIYASTADFVNGAKLNPLALVPVPAIRDKLYTLEATGTISGPTIGGSLNAFSLVNKYTPKPYLTIGLYQDALVNGTDILGNAISGVPVLLQSTVEMTTSQSLYIWLQSQVKGNSVSTKVTSPITQLNFGNGIEHISVSYNSATGHFYPSGAKLESNAIAHHEPIL